MGRSVDNTDALALLEANGDATMTPPRLEIRLLGQFELRVDGVCVEPEKPSRKADALLAYLALNAGLTHERSKLIDLFCLNVKDPAGDFRGILKRARDMAGKDTAGQFYRIVNVNGEGALRFEPTPNLWVDAVEFQKPLGHAPQIEDLIERAALYAGSFLHGYEIRWVEDTRAGLDRQFSDLMKRLLEELYADERWTDLAAWAEHWIAHSDLPPTAYTDMMEAYSELGDLPKLDSIYKRYIHALGEIGVQPSEDLDRQYGFLRKTLERGFGNPAVASKKAPVVPSNLTQPNKPKPLPLIPTTFIGRAADLVKIDEKLKNAECQLVVLVGIGGVGKTRLALQAAQDSSPQFGDGVAYVDVGQVTDVEMFASALADALNFTPRSQEPLWTQVQNYLREKQALIVFDGFERAMQAWAQNAVADCVQLLDELLNAAPRVKALVTSRERLRLQREHLLAIEGLDYPPSDVDGDEASAEEIDQYGAVKLFMGTARRVRIEFNLRDEKAGVVRICRRVQGLPLAINLAAVHVVGMSAAQIADEIDANLDLPETSAVSQDGDERHRSVRATFEYSWEMLTPDERQVFARLSAFAGGFGRDAALNVAIAPRGMLNTLVSNALLRYDFKTERYDLHDLLRQFGGEKLARLGDKELPKRMADYYLSFARRNQNRHEVLEPEWGNFLAAARAAHWQRRWQTVMDFAEVLTEPWFTRARFSDARQGFVWAREAATKAKNDPARLAFTTWHGRALIQQGDYDDAQVALEQSAQLASRLQDQLGLANARFEQARIAWERSQYVQAHKLLQASRQIRMALSDAHGVAETLRLEAWIAYNQNRYAEAMILAEQVLAIYEAGDQKRSLAQTLRLLTIIATEQKLYDQAQAYCQRALAICAEMNDEHESAEVLYASSQLHFRLGDHGVAVERAHKSLGLFRKVGDRKNQAHVSLMLCYIHEDLQEFATALGFANQGLLLYRSLRDEWCMVYCLLCAGDFLNQLGQKDQGRASWSEGLQLAKKLGHPDLGDLEQRLQ